MVEIKIIKEEYSKLKITFPYNPTHVEKIKAFKGSWWHPKEKYCTIPYSDGDIEKITAIFDGKKIDLDPNLQVGKKGAKISN